MTCDKNTPRPFESSSASYPERKMDLKGKKRQKHKNEKKEKREKKGIVSYIDYHSICRI